MSGIAESKTKMSSVARTQFEPNARTGNAQLFTLDRS